MANVLELEPYRKDVECRKCGSDLVIVEYKADIELMLRSCSECGFQFFQVPLDRAKEIKQVKAA